MNERIPEPKHLAYIDAIRGMAFLAVLTVHAVLSAGRFPGSRVLIGGGYGVELFFLASAITLCFSMSARKKNEVYPVGFFFMRRFFRIAPLFWCGLVFYWLFPGLRVDLPDYPLHTSYYVLTALFMHGWHPYTFNSIVPGGWSIAVEMSFYVLFPLLYFYLNSLRRAALAVVVGVILTKIEILLVAHYRYSLFGNVEEAPFQFLLGKWLPSELAVFCIGIFVYHVLRLPLTKRLAGNSLFSSAIFIFSGLAIVGVLRTGSAFIPMHLVVSSFLALGIIAISGSAVPAIVNPVICFIGRISFSCYIWHFAVITFVIRDLGLSAGSGVDTSSGHGLSHLVHFATLFLVTFALTIPIATLSNRLIENPGIALGRNLIRKINALHLEEPQARHPALRENP